MLCADWDVLSAVGVSEGGVEGRVCTQGYRIAGKQVDGIPSQEGRGTGVQLRHTCCSGK